MIKFILQAFYFMKFKVFSIPPTQNRETPQLQYRYRALILNCLDQGF